MTALSPTGLQVIERLDNTLNFWVQEIDGPDADLASEAILEVEARVKAFVTTSPEEEDALAFLKGGLEACLNFIGR